MPSRTDVRLLPRIRVVRGESVLLGPGKADLLEAVDRTGTIADAARALGMSYMRAWTLIQAMNASFRSPVVETQRGGSGRGSARLTRAGRTALRLYREMEDASRAAMRPAWGRLQRMLRTRARHT